MLTRNDVKFILAEKFDLVETFMDDAYNRETEPEEAIAMEGEAMEIVDAELAGLAGESMAYWLMTGDAAC